MSVTLNQHRQRSTRQRGSVLIVVIVCLSVAATLLLGALRTSLQQRRQLREQRQIQQATWLVDAGVRHARSQFSQDENYQGETLQLSEKLPGIRKATLTIEIDESGDDAGQVPCRITARLLGDSKQQKTWQRSGSVFLQQTNTAQQNDSANE